LNILFTFRSFEQLAFALKNRGCPDFTVLNMYFLLFRIFEQLAVALKNRVVLKIFTVFKDFLSFRIFGQLALALKTEFAPPRPPASYAYACGELPRHTWVYCVPCGVYD